MENIDIDKDNSKNIDIDMAILENIDIDIDKGILQNIDIHKISYRLGFGISNTPIHERFDILLLCPLYLGFLILIALFVRTHIHDVHGC